MTKVSEEQAFAEFKDKYEDQPDLYQDLDLGVFPASVQIQLEDSDSANDVAGRLKQQGFTERNLSYPQQTIDRLNSVTSYVIWGLYGATLLFLIASVLLISNAIRLSIFARRKEIEGLGLLLRSQAPGSRARTRTPEQALEAVLAQKNRPFGVRSIRP